MPLTLPESCNFGEQSQRARSLEVEPRAVRTMFVLYALLIVGGIAASVTIGLTSG